MFYFEIRAPRANPDSLSNTRLIARLLTGSLSRRPGRGLALWLTTLVLFVACQAVPTKPEAVFNLYREKMRNNQIPQARELLTDSTRALISEMEAKYKTDQPVENLALLNALDPEAPVAVIQNEKTTAVVQARTLRGGLRLIKLSRKDETSPWQTDLTPEIKSLESFLKAREALDLIRAQAGEYAASLEAFNQQLGRIQAQEETSPPSSPQHKKPAPAPPKPKPKPGRSVQRPH
jgi:hypothetical protein